MKAVNLVPSDQRAGGTALAGSSEGGAFIVLGLMAGLAVLALLYGVAHHQISSRDGQAATLSAEAAQAQTEANRLAPYTSFIAMRDQRRQAISQLVGSRFDWAHAFHELGRVLPFDVSLTSVHGAVGTEGAPAATASTTTTTSTSTSTSASASASAGATPAASAASSTVASATPPGTIPSFTVVGCATSQSEVAQTLDRLRLMDGVADVELQSSTKTSSGSPSNSSGSSGGCPDNDPSFTVKINFSPLPTPPAAGTPAPGSGAGTTTAASTTTTTTTSDSASGSAKTTAANGGS